MLGAMAGLRNRLRPVGDSLGSPGSTNEASEIAPGEGDSLGLPGNTKLYELSCVFQEDTGRMCLRLESPSGDIRTWTVAPDAGGCFGCGLGERGLPLVGRTGRGGDTRCSVACGQSLALVLLVGWVGDTGLAWALLAGRLIRCSVGIVPFVGWVGDTGLAWVSPAIVLPLGVGWVGERRRGGDTPRVGCKGWGEGGRCCLWD
eukprot:gene19986-biopygen844